MPYVCQRYISPKAGEQQAALAGLKEKRPARLSAKDGQGFVQHLSVCDMSNSGMLISPILINLLQSREGMHRAQGRTAITELIMDPKRVGQSE